MSTEIDNKVVSMQFDNRKFDRNIQTSIGSIEQLKGSLNMNGVEKGFNRINTAAEGMKFSGLQRAMGAVTSKFSALEIMAVTALANITNSAVNAGKRIVKALTIDPIKTGFAEYETQINAVQTILTNTKRHGSTLEDVNNALDELNKYADKTIYNFTQMTKSIGMFTTAGVDLETSASAVKGIANLAAFVGAPAEDATRAMYQLSQALSTGTVRLQDWMSLEHTSGMGGKEFQDRLVETAKVHGMNVEKMIEHAGSFRETLKSGWLTTEILTETLAQFAGEVDEATLKQKGYNEEQIKSILALGKDATDAATKVKTFTQLFDTLGEAAQSGWTETWETIVGDFEEAKALLTEASNIFGDIIAASAKARNDVIKGWKAEGGRTTLIDSFGDIIKAAVEFSKIVKGAFHDIFPKATSKTLLNITNKFRAFAANLTKVTDISDKLRRVFRGVFSVFGIIKNIIVQIAKALKPAVGFMGKAATPILDTAAAFGDWLYNLNQTIAKSTVIQKVVTTIVSVVKKVIGYCKQLITLIKDNFNPEPFKKIWDYIKGATTSAKEFIFALKDKINFEGFSKLKDIFGKIWDKIKGAASSIVEFKDKSVETIDEVSKKVTGSGLYKVLMTIWKVLLTIITAVGKLLGDIGKGLFDAISSTDLDSVLDFVTTIVSGGVGVSLINFFSNLNKTIKPLGDTFKDLKLSEFGKSIKGVFGEMRGVLESYQKKLKAGTLYQIAKAVALLAASLVVLSFVPADKLSSAINALTLLFTGLLSSFAILSKTGKSLNLSSLSSISGILISMASAILILSIALTSLGNIPADQLAQGVTGVSALLGIMVAFCKIMQSKEKMIISGAAQMIGFAIAIRVLASSVKALGNLNWKQLAKGLYGVAGLLVSIGLFLSNSKMNSMSVRTGIGIILVATAIRILASSVKVFSSMNLGQIYKGLLAVAGLLATVAIFVKETEGIKGIFKVGTSLILIATSIRILASAIAAIGSLSLVQVMNGLLGIGGALTAILVALQYMPDDISTKSLALGSLAVSVTILAGALKILSTITGGGIIVALVGLGGALAILVTALNAMEGTIEGSLALIAASVAIGLLTPSLAILGNMRLKTIAKGLLAIGASFAVLGIAAAILGPLTPAILALSGAFALLGIGAAGVGVGLMAIGAGLVSLSAGIASFAASSTAIISAFVAKVGILVNGLLGLIPIIVNRISEGIISLIKLIGDNADVIITAVKQILVALIGLIRDVVPPIIEVLVSLIDSTLKTIAEHTPSIVESLMNILYEFLNGLAQNIGRVTQAAFDIMIGFMDGLIEKIPDLVEKAFEIIVAFINGLTNALAENDDALIDAIKRLALQLIDTLFKVLEGSIDLIKGIGKKIIESGFVQGIKEKFISAKNAVKDLIHRAKEAIVEKFTEWKNAGKDLIQGFIDGIKDMFYKVKEAISNLGSKVIGWFKDKLGIHSPSRITKEMGQFLDQGLINGMNAYSKNVKKASEEVSDSALLGLQSGLSDMSKALEPDAEFVIKPVVDMTDIQRGSSTMDALFGKNYAFRGSIDEANRISAKMRTTYSGKDSAINDNFAKLTKALEGSNGQTTQNTFYINGTNAKEIANEVSKILQSQVERRNMQYGRSNI